MIFLFFNLLIFILILSILSLFSIFSFFLHAGQFAILETLDCRKKILPGSRIKSSYLSSRRLLSAFGRAEAPIVALDMRPAFSFALNHLALRSGCAKRTGQLQIFCSALCWNLSEKKHLHEAPKDRRLIPEKIQQAFCIRFALKRMQKLIVYTVSCL